MLILPWHEIEKVNTFLFIIVFNLKNKFEIWINNLSWRWKYCHLDTIFFLIRWCTLKIAYFCRYRFLCLNHIAVIDACKHILKWNCKPCGLITWHILLSTYSYRAPDNFFLSIFCKTFFYHIQIINSISAPYKERIWPFYPLILGKYWKVSFTKNRQKQKYAVYKHRNQNMSNTDAHLTSIYIFAWTQVLQKS
jgi:hypothetical protein